ncbi:VPLPA-CTERM protein sorting domain-containing protein [Rhodovulum sp. ES.010]|uniref:VPLPA-CTERM sorting domain-containing protein n=1 Tax=Rhodovulum sp. ES.010 TaxID=1882821 RepID=UPI0009274FFC|nr:VPLPA-CTERM sorting domain-containing protein [Rhodovulum sp. ES.010]SIO45964.1 VPLPA-CTERM protein sorting domain-containing protein [Rhodovulum sp. ES.010]
MKRHISAALVTAGLAFGALQAQAASLGLPTGAPSLSSSAAFIDYIEFAPDGDLSTFGAAVDSTDGVSPTGLTEIGFGVGFSLADPTAEATGGFDVFDEDGLFLAGDLLAVGFTEDVIEFRFGNLSGSGAGAFGSSVLALIAFDDPLGANPFDSFADGDFYSASITISNVVPLPAGLALLLGGLGGMALLRRRPGG